MMPGVLTVDDQNLEKQLEKQMGCMSGFLQIFDRQHIISGKRIYGPKRIPSFSATESTSPSERSDLSVKEESGMFPSSPENLTETPVKGTVPLPVFDFKEGMKNSWKLREAPRLSLDSRLRPREIRTSQAAYAPNQPDSNDADSDKNRRSPSVVARLMGLDALPGSAAVGDDGEQPKQAELRRSASESRVSRDLHRFVDGSFFQRPPPPSDFAGNAIYRLLPSESKPTPVLPKPAPAVATSLQRKSYFNAQDFFPEPNRIGSRCLYGEIEKRLRMRGIDEPAKDLETLKHVFEALQLKGLLHWSDRPSNHQIEHRRNLISDHPIVVMKPGLRPVRRSESEPPRPVSVRRAPPEERRVQSRSPRSPNPNPRRPVNNLETTRKISSVHSSPRSSPRRVTPDPVSSRSPRNRKSARECGYSPAEEDTASSPHFDLERSRVEYSAGRSLLERCDKLLHSIAAFTSAEQVTTSDQQPSPVSVLDSSFLGDESSPSPVMKRSIEFKDPLADWEDEDWVPADPGSRPVYVAESEYSDFAYVANAVTAAERHPDSPLSDVYSFLERRHEVASRLLLDTVSEILERKRRMSAWESFARRGAASVCGGSQLIRDVWAEVRRVGEEVEAEDLNAVTCGAIRKDMACGDHGWGDTSAEMSDAVLNIERLVFKDLVVEMIRDLADLAGGHARNPLPRRKLLF